MVETGNLTDITLEALPRLAQMRKRLLSQPAVVCIERARLLTEYLRAPETAAASPKLRYAGAVRHVLSHKKILLFEDSLIAGSTTSKPFGAPVYPEFTGLMIWPELDTISTRKRNPQLLDPRDGQFLDREIFPFWMDKTILETTRRQFSNPPCLKLFEQLVYFIAGKAGCMSHTVPCYLRALKDGTAAIRAEVAWQIDRSSNDSNASLDFLRSVDCVLEGVEIYARRCAEEAMSQAEKSPSPERRAELLEIGRICAKVPREGASTLHEAIQSLWILQVAIHAENINMAMSPGRLDQLLHPYCKADSERGSIDQKQAMELLGSLWLAFNDNTCLVPESSEELFGGAGTVPAVTIGGVDETGADAVNECTYLILRVAELLAMRDPSLNARYHRAVNGKEYRDRVAEVIASTRCIPAVYNDEAAVETLRNQGVSLGHSRDYAIIGCVELASAGRSYDASSSIILNLPAVIELALCNGKRPSTSGDAQIGPETGEPASFETFEQFFAAFATQFSWLAGQAIELNEYFGAIHRAQQPSPLLSALFEGPLDRGMDLVDGGALYNSSGATHIGFADTVDSLCAIRQIVFEEKLCSFQKLLAAVLSNFEGETALRARLVNRAPKFGTNHPIALELSRRLAGFLCDYYQAHVNYRGGRYRPAYWSMTNHVGQGMLCGALPSGRGKGESFASGMTPSAGAAPELTACLRAVASLDCRTIPGGMALNLKYPAITGKEDVLCLAETIEAYAAMGGMHVQFNVVTREMLMDAKKRPHAYPNLLVRVSGYSAYFADLTPRMQDEIIERTSYDPRHGSIAEAGSNGTKENHVVAECQ